MDESDESSDSSSDSEALSCDVSVVGTLFHPRVRDEYQQVAGHFCTHFAPIDAFI